MPTVPMTTRLAYRIYLASCSAAYGARITTDPPHRNLFYISRISPLLADSLCKTFNLEQDVSIEGVRENADPRYKVPNSIMPRDEYLKSVPHKKIEISRALVSSAFKAIAAEIEPILGYHVKIINTRFFSLLGGFVGGAYTSKHQDNFPPGLYKVLVYLSGASASSGTTRIHVGTEKNGYVDLELGSGGYCLFDSNNISHEAVPPTDLNARRITLELTIGPSFKTDLTIPSPGFYAFYPHFPLDYFDVIMDELERLKSAK